MQLSWMWKGLEPIAALSPGADRVNLADRKVLRLTTYSGVGRPSRNTLGLTALRENVLLVERPKCQCKKPIT